MDLETENRIAAILLKEAAELRRQADRDGVGVYLQKPNVRGRPNSRFLTATVLGVQQANRAVEVNEMWRVRQKELELNDKLKKRSKDVSGSGRNHRDVDNSARSTSKRHEDNARTSYMSSKGVMENCCSRKDEGLRDEEVEEFLHSRIKRGRGSVGSRMDETGPYLPTGSESPRRLSLTPVAMERHVMLGPEKPSSLRFHDDSSDEELPEKPSSRKSHSHEPSSSDEELHKHRNKKRKKAHSSSDKKSSRKHKSKEKSRDKKKKWKEERRR